MKLTFKNIKVHTFYNSKAINKHVQKSRKTWEIFATTSFKSMLSYDISVTKKWLWNVVDGLDGLSCLHPFMLSLRHIYIRIYVCKLQPFSTSFVNFFTTNWSFERPTLKWKCYYDVKKFSGLLRIYSFSFISFTPIYSDNLDMRWAYNYFHTLQHT